MVCVSVFLSRHVWVQIGGFLTIIGVAVYVSAVRSPYYYPLYNRLECALGVGAGVLALLGGAAYGGADEASVFGLVITLLIAVGAVIVSGVVVDTLEVWKGVRGGGEGVDDGVRVRVVVKMLEEEIGDLEEGVAVVVGGVVDELTKGHGGEVDGVELDRMM